MAVEEPHVEKPHLEEPAPRRHPTLLKERNERDFPRPEVLAAYVPDVFDGTAAPILRQSAARQGAGRRESTASPSKDSMADGELLADEPASSELLEVAEDLTDDDGLARPEFGEGALEQQL